MTFEMSACKESFTPCNKRADKPEGIHGEGAARDLKIYKASPHW
jgi:hypothetical protein